MNIEQPGRTQIRAVKAKVEDEILSREGVVGVDIAEKISDGEPTGELSIVVFVRQKQPKSKLTKSQLIPAEIDGVKTDVLEETVELHTAYPVGDAELSTDTGTYRPLVGGISIGPARTFYRTPPDVPAPGHYTFVGTLGALVKDRATGAVMALTNFHVGAVDTTWSAGDVIVQPGRPDGGSSPGSDIGTLNRAVLSDRVDGAVIDVAAGIDTEASITEIGAVAGSTNAAVGQVVRKRGRTTGLTHGTVVSTDFTTTVDFGPGIGPRTLHHQIRVTPNTAESERFSNSGDSGSVVVEGSGRVIGLLFAGATSGAWSLLNPIQSVLNELNVEILVGPPALLPTRALCPVTRPAVCPPLTRPAICPPLTRLVADCPPLTRLVADCPPLSRITTCPPRTRTVISCAQDITRYIEITRTVSCFLTRHPLLCGGLDKPIDSFPFAEYGGGAPSVDEAFWAGYLAGMEEGEDG